MDVLAKPNAAQQINGRGGENSDFVTELELLFQLTFGGFAPRINSVVVQNRRMPPPISENDRHQPD